jgi:hypothetical protein
MAISHIDFAIATGLFLVFIGMLFGYVVSYLVDYRSMAETSELRGVASDLFNAFFIGKGVPGSWEEQGLTPLKIGLMDKLYLIVINVSETNGSYRNNIEINGTIDFDSSCERKVLNTTARLYNSSNSQIPFQLYNQTFCDGSYLKRSDIVFNLSLEPYESELFFLYFSSQKSVEAPNYSLDFPVNETNYSFQTFPIQELQAISVDKLKALRNLSYEEVLQTIPKGYEFRVEIS